MGSLALLMDANVLLILFDSLRLHTFEISSNCKFDAVRFEKGRRFYINLTIFQSFTASYVVSIVNIFFRQKTVL